MTAKSLRGKSVRSKPPKVKGSPLTPHASGQYCARLAGKIRYFGKEHDAALRKFQDAKAGFDVHDTRLNVAEVVSLYLDDQQAKQNRGELDLRTLNDYHAVFKRFASFIGRDRPFESLGPKDFAALRATYTGAASTVNREIGTVRAMLNWAEQSEYGRVNPGPNFSMVPRKVQRLQRKARGPKRFTMREIWKVQQSACPQLRAMILLAINCGFGNTDCSELRISDVDLDGQWLSMMRSKTGVDRDAWLWPETVEALREAINKRYTPSDEADADRVFITKYKTAWLKEGARTNAISQAFTKLTKKAGIHRPGVSFYALRHTFRSEADHARDAGATRRIMGHVDDSIDAIYIEEHADALSKQAKRRIRHVCEYVRRCFLAGRYSTVTMHLPEGCKPFDGGAK